MQKNGKKLDQFVRLALWNYYSNLHFEGLNFVGRLLQE